MKLKRIKDIDEDTRKVIFHDLECLELKETKDNKYHYDLLKGNLIDLLGYPKED